MYPRLRLLEVYLHWGPKEVLLLEGGMQDKDTRTEAHYIVARAANDITWQAGE